MHITIIHAREIYIHSSISTKRDATLIRERYTYITACTERYALYINILREVLTLVDRGT